MTAAIRTPCPQGVTSFKTLLMSALVRSFTWRVPRSGMMWRSIRPIVLPATSLIHPTVSSICSPAERKKAHAIGRLRLLEHLSGDACPESYMLAYFVNGVAQLARR